MTAALTVDPTASEVSLGFTIVAFAALLSNNNYLNAAFFSVMYNCMMILIHRSLLEQSDTFTDLSAIQSQRVCTTAAINIVDSVDVWMASMTEYFPRSLVG